MAGITLDLAQTNLDLWLEASAKVARGQAYQIGTRSMRRADLKEIAEMIRYWDRLVQQLTARGGARSIRVRAVLPRDV